MLSCRVTRGPLPAAKPLPARFRFGGPRLPQSIGSILPDPRSELYEYVDDCESSDNACKLCDPRRHFSGQPVPEVDGRGGPAAGANIGCRSLARLEGVCEGGHYAASFALEPRRSSSVGKSAVESAIPRVAASSRIFGCLHSGI